MVDVYVLRKENTKVARKNCYKLWDLNKVKIKTLFIVQIDNKSKWEYNEYIVKNDKNKNNSKTQNKKCSEMRKKAAAAAEWGKRWEKKRKPPVSRQ